MINETLRKNINVDKENILPISTFKEGDNAILKLALFKNSTEFDITEQTVRLGAKTKGGLIEQIDGFTISKNNLDIKLKNSILVPGIIEIDLEMEDAKGTMTTASFFITVNQKVLNDEAVEATNEFDTFTKTVDKIESDYTGLRRIIIDENQATSLQDQINNINSSLDHKANDLELEVERKRIDNLSKLGEGSTTGDAELIDGRVGADGLIYANIGDSIRQQSKKLTNDIQYLKKGIETFGSYAKFDNGTLVNGQFEKNNVKRIASDDIITFDRDLEITVSKGYQLTLCQFQDGVYVKDLAYVTNSYTLLKGTSVKALIKLVDETNAVDNPSILEFLSKVTFNTKINKKISELDCRTLLNKMLVTNASKGIDTFGNHCTIELGTVDGGVVSYKKNRITSNDILHFDYDIDLKIVDGYRFGMSIMDSNGTYKTWSGWQTGNYTIKANTYFKPLIAKITEDDNLVNLIEMNNAVTFDSRIKQNSISSENSYKDSIELLPGGFGYPGTGAIYSGGYPTNRFVTRNIQQAPYDLVVGFKEPSANILYQVAFYQSDTNEVAINSDILFKEYRYEKCIIPKGTHYRIVYAITGETTSEQYNHGYDNLMIEKHEKNITSPTYNTLLPSSPKIALHKGYSTKAPENSESAFLLGAKESSVYALECDIQITSDGEFVLYHDEDLSSRTNGSGAINNKTFAEVTSYVYNNNVKGLENYPNEHICSLEKYLKICKRYGKIALCEFKFTANDRSNIEHFKNFVKLLYKTGMQNSVIVMSFTASELAMLHHVDKNIYALLVQMSYDKFDYRLCGLVNNYGVNINYESSSAGSGLTESQIEDAHLKGLTVGVWTIDDDIIKENYRNYGVDLITSNNLL